MNRGSSKTARIGTPSHEMPLPLPQRRCQLPALPAPTKLARQATLKPSDRRHALCASINSAHLSSPSDTTHSSRGLFVSGHEQQIFLPDLPSAGFFFSGSGILPLLVLWLTFTRHTKLTLTIAVSPAKPKPHRTTCTSNAGPVCARGKFLKTGVAECFRCCSNSASWPPRR